MSDQELFHRTVSGAPRIEALTGVRWLAAFAVFLHHNQASAGDSSWWRNFMASGSMGVTIFFVLSGFILTVIYQEVLSSPKSASVWNYAVARAARIFPLYVFVFVCLMILFLSQGQPLSRGWWVYLLALQAWSPNLDFAYGINPPGWTIGVETFLYAMFPLIVVLVRPLRERVRGILTLAVATVAVMTVVAVYFELSGRADLLAVDPNSAHRWIYRTPVLRLGDFILGIAVAMLYLRLRTSGPKRPWAAWVSSLSLAAILVLMCLPSLLDTAFSFDVLYAVPGAVLILSLALSPNVGLARILGSRPLVMLGEISFAFYLIHVPLQSYIGFPMQGGVSITNVASLGVVLALLIATSLGLNELVERPARVMIRRIASSPSAKLL